MAENARFSSTGKLASRLNHLFATVHPRDRGPYSNEEVARAIREQGGDISKAYLAYLRNGTRSNPTMHHLEALAAFFSVKPAYFFDDEVAEEVDSMLVRLVALREAGLQLSEWEALRDAGITKIAARANGLSPKGLVAAAEILDQLRALEGLPLERDFNDS
ncbi:helix-turn-helix domain-containing protein [Streptomyces auratus]|uniref:Helix-turn-helix transcriptional regulator n=1 Tax=Streptomyces auratus AGR0001 TaxID=1160718 RepID=A0A8B1NLL4_9ACTN|nr:helix-turn-helix transcriptional regulator [Streptomyces auratus]QTZ94655.1 helix-turn-helix transcriptional regulator [Streptomyces auratus AGR0001]